MRPPTSPALCSRTRLCLSLSPRWLTSLLPPVPCAVLPGLLIQVAQNRADQYFDEKIGIDKFDTSYGVAIFRVVLGHSLQLLAMLVFLMHLHEDDTAAAHRSSALIQKWDSDMSMYMYAMLMLMGIGMAIVYGTYAQAVSMFPKRFHAFFFIGTYAVSSCVSSSPLPAPLCA